MIKAMRLIIYHGRDDPDQRLNDWGYDGPTIEGIVAVHGTYGNLNVFFGTEGAVLQAIHQTGWDRFCDMSLMMRFHNELLVLVEPYGCTRYYGDWELQTQNGMGEPVGIG